MTCHPVPRSSALLVVLTALLLADACRLPEPVVPTADSMLIGADLESTWGGAGGFDIVAGWDKPFSAPFDATATSVSWTDGQDLFVGRDFASGVALGVVPPPPRWRSDAQGLMWTTGAGELWTAAPGIPARILWRYPGRAEAFAPGRTCVFVTLTTGGAPDGSELPPDAPREIWRVARATGQAVRVALVAGEVAAMVADGDDLFFTDRGARLHHVEGGVEHDREVTRTLPGLLGVDARYVYGGDRAYLYRASKSGGAAMAIAHFGDWGRPSCRRERTRRWTTISCSGLKAPACSRPRPPVERNACWPTFQGAWDG